ncbi:MAG: NYN domain-containing protein [Acidobacteriota bacterium]
MSPEVRGDEPWRAAEPAPAIDRPAVDPFSLPYDDEAEGLEDEPELENAAEARGSNLADIAEHEDGDDEGEDEEEGEIEGEPVAGEGAERPGRKRGRRGGRRRRGRGNQAESGDAEPAPAIAAVPAPRPTERHERAERPERVAALERPQRQERQERHERHEVTELPPVDLESLTRQIYMSMPERSQSVADERKIALFCDLENVALGVRDSEIKKFDINLVLERLLEKGKIIVKRAYCDWERYSDYKRTFHEAAIELIDIPQKHYSGKNSADIKMVVDAMDLSYSKEHLDTFVLLSGDSDFSPLVSKLKENNKYVIGIGVKNSSSALLVDNCDEFIYYEDVWRDQHSGPQLEGLTKKQTEVFGIMIDSIQALKRENKDVLWGSMIKQTMKRKKPSFNEGYYGYSTFSELLEDAERRGVVKLKKDQRSGSYIVTGFASRA